MMRTFPFYRGLLPLALLAMVLVAVGAVAAIRQTLANCSDPESSGEVLEWITYTGSDQDFEIDVPITWSTATDSPDSVRFLDPRGPRPVPFSVRVLVYEDLDRLPGPTVGANLLDWIEGQVSDGVFLDARPYRGSHVTGYEAESLGLVNFRTILVESEGRIYWLSAPRLTDDLTLWGEVAAALDSFRVSRSSLKD